MSQSLLQLVSYLWIWITWGCLLCIDNGWCPRVSQDVNVHCNVGANKTVVRKLASKPSNFWIIFFPFWNRSRSSELRLFLLKWSAVAICHARKKLTVKGFWQRSMVLARWSRSLEPKKRHQRIFWLASTPTYTMSHTVIRIISYSPWSKPTIGTHPEPVFMQRILYNMA